ncbi:MAG TPA: helix-turn-helix domain-containing protein [Ktedonobacteraceae bacterium]|nr:helix-turn-helix domain-containing protein [Ktedonobacteraceae bacterium]
MHEALLDVQDVAERLKLNPRTVIRMAERGDLAAAKVARRWRFRARDVDEYLQSQIEENMPDEKQGRQVKYQWSIPSPVEENSHGAAQITDISKRDFQLATVKQRLELEKQRLELQKEKLDLKTKRIDDALEMVDMLQPDINADKKAELLQSLLQNLLRQLDPALLAI